MMGMMGMMGKNLWGALSLPFEGQDALCNVYS